jgi:hypothetical protein
MTPLPRLSEPVLATLTLEDIYEMMTEPPRFSFVMHDEEEVILYLGQVLFEHRYGPLFVDAKKIKKGLTKHLVIYTLRIYDGTRAKSHTRAAWLVASKACRSSRRRSEQHRAPRAGRARDQGIFGASHTPDRRAA